MCDFPSSINTQLWREREGFVPLTYSSIIHTSLDICFYNVKRSFKYILRSPPAPPAWMPWHHVDAVKIETIQSSSRVILSHIFFKI